MTAPLSMDQAFISEITAIVLANLRDENFGVDELSREARISRTTIHRKIRSIRNQNVSQFIKEIRLRRAMELLRQNVGTVSEIAFMVGFGSPAYFNKCFHDFFGFSPGTVKKDVFRDDGEIVPARVIDTIERKKPLHHPYVLMSAGVLSLVVLIYLGYFFIGKSHTGNAISPGNGVISVAVLPFRNLTDSVSNQYFIDGIAEEILASLSKIKDLTVHSRSSVEQFLLTGKPLSEISAILDVNYLVEGSGQKLGDKLVLRVALTDAENSKEIWAKPYSRQILKTTDLVSLQSEIAQTIASELNAVITPEEKLLIENRPDFSLTAYDFYQKAREELGKFAFHDLIVTSTTYPIFFDYPTDRKAIERARMLFKTALSHDSTFAPAYVELAAINWSENYFGDYFSENYLDSVLILSNKALSFDDKLADAYYMRAMYYGETGNIEQARSDFDKTLQLDPNHWQAYYGKGCLYLEAFPDADYTIALDNFLKAASRYHGSALPFLLERIGYVLNITGFSDMAYKYNLQASQLELDSAKYYLSRAYLAAWSGDTNTIRNRSYLEQAYVKNSDNIGILRARIGFTWEKGDYSGCLRIYRKYRELLKEHRITMVNELHRWAPLYSIAGMNDSAEYLYNKQIEYCNEAIKLGRPYGRSFAYYDLAIIYGSRGDRKKALENLNKFKDRQGMCLWFGISGLEYGKLADDPEFQKIDKVLKAGYKEEHERVKKWLEEHKMI